MLISYKWLKNYLPDLDNYQHKHIADALTEGLAEVESYIQKGKGLEKLVAGEIRTIEKYPGKDKLSVCNVLIGKEERIIICGANNVREGMKVVVCLPGGKVYNPSQPLGSQELVKIEQRKIGDIVSDGMICSAKELGIEDNHKGILELENETESGRDITELLQDVIFEIENKSISHRPDCFSHMGIAREISALLNTDFQPRNLETPIIPSASLQLKVEKKVNNDLCPRFTAIVLKDIAVADSPLWLRLRLAYIGIRPVNNIVDITNYVMMDVGQPMHAFDYDKLGNGKLIVRQAKDNEEITALDGKKYKLSQEDLVIADGEKCVSIAGIMGGEDTAISGTTRNAVLEAAAWNMYSIRKTSRRLGLRSEASTRFEKGQDPNNTVTGIKTALELILDLSQAEIASELIDIYEEPRTETILELEIPSVKRFLGIEITKPEIIETLSRLQINLLSREIANTNQLQDNIELFQIPTHRPDLKIPQDLMEEIARLYGYSNIPAILPLRESKPAPLNPISSLMRLVKSLLSSQQLDELMTYSFISAKLYRKTLFNIKDCVQLENPLSPELGYMRTSLIPSLLEKTEFNSHNFDEFAFFEVGRISLKKKDSDGIHLQPRRVTAVSYNRKGTDQFFIIKHVLEQLLQSLHIPHEFNRIDKNRFPYLHPGRAAEVVSETGENLGIIGEIHPQIINNLGMLQGRVGCFEIDFDMLEKLYSPDPKYTKLSEYPDVVRDLSFWVDTGVTFQSIKELIRSLDIKLLRELSLVDVFTPKNDKSRKSITVSLTLQSYKATLTENQINETLKQITDALETKLKAEMRK